MLLRRVLALLLLSVASAVSGGDPHASNDVLNNKNNGHNPCEMQTDFQHQCTTERSDNSDTITSRALMPGPCTCSNAYFNLWSVCVYITDNLDNSTLPDTQALTANCTKAGYDVASMNETTDPDTGFPGWVFAALPTNGTFDVTAAIRSSIPPSHKWTLVQIVVPIIVGLAVAVVFLLGFVWYRRRKRARMDGRMDRPWMRTTNNTPRFHFPALKNVIKVKELNRSSSWSIDEREEPLDEYQFVSYPNSMQGSQTSGHVRLSSSTSATHPPSLSITTGKAAPVRAWPGRSLWIGPYTSAKRVFDTVPLPWRSAKRVHVKNMGSYGQFRVDSDDSDSPLSQRRHESLMAAATQSQSNLRNETIFEREEEREDDSDSETEHLPLITQEQVRPSRDEDRSHRAAVPAAPSPTPSPRHSRRSAAPQIPLPLPPPQPSQPMSPPSTSRAPRSAPAFPPAPTSPPPPPPPSTRSPRVARPGLPIIPPPPPLLPPPLSRANPPPPLPLASTSNSRPYGASHRHERSDSFESLRSLPTPRQPHARNNSDSSSTLMTPTPPYVGGAQPQAMMSPAGASDASASPPSSAPPYVQRPSLDAVHSPVMSPRPSGVGLRRLPQPPS